MTWKNNLVKLIIHNNINSVLPLPTDVFIFALSAAMFYFVHYGALVSTGVGLTSHTGDHHIDFFFNQQKEVSKCGNTLC